MSCYCGEAIQKVHFLVYFYSISFSIFLATVGSLVKVWSVSWQTFMICSIFSTITLLFKKLLQGLSHMQDMTGPCYIVKLCVAAFPTLMIALCHDWQWTSQRKKIQPQLHSSKWDHFLSWGFSKQVALLPEKQNKH